MALEHNRSVEHQAVVFSPFTPPEHLEPCLTGGTVKPSLISSGTGRLIVSPNVATSPLGDELAVLDTRNGEYYTMNGTGAFLWTKLQMSCSSQTLLADLIESFEVDEAAAKAQIADFLDELLAADLIRPADA